MWGRLRYLIIYALSGLDGSCLGLAMRPAAASAGASGALCGVVAAAAVWWLCNGRCLPRALARELRINMLINGVLITLISLMPGVGGWGHLGGALAGAAAALALQAQRFARPPWRWAAPLALLALPWLGYAVIERQRATDPAWAPFGAAAGRECGLAIRAEGDFFGLWKPRRWPCSATPPTAAGPALSPRPRANRPSQPTAAAAPPAEARAGIGRGPCGQAASDSRLPPQLRGRLPYRQ